MHIMLDETSTPPRIKILNIAEWSPLQAHVLHGDTLDAIDRVPCNSLTFEQVPIFAPINKPSVVSVTLAGEPEGPGCLK
jgi:hypothetical protein